jgi:hypothetical protein
MKFLHAADIHLDSPLHGLQRYEGAPVAELRSATRRAFDNLIALAIDESVDFVLLAGDLYDGDGKDYNTGLYFVERMNRLQHAGIPVFLIAGNHDAASRITRHLRLPDNVHAFATDHPGQQVISDLGVAIVGQGYATRTVSDDLAAGYPQADPQWFTIGLLHTCLDGKPGHEPYAPCTVDGLRSKGYQYWALGHVHRREVISREPWIVFPGNIQGRHIRETGAKGCTLVTVADGVITGVESRDLDVLRWSLCEVDVGGSPDNTQATPATPDAAIDDVLSRVTVALQQELDKADGRPVALRLVLTGACAAHAALQSDREHWEQECRALASGLGGAGLWLEKLVLRTHSPLSVAEISAGDDALGSLLAGIEALKRDPDGEALAHLATEFTALSRKLPTELRSGADPSAAFDSFDPADPAQILAALDDVEALLTARLSAAGSQR